MPRGVEHVYEGYQLWQAASLDHRKELEHFAYRFMAKVRRRGREGASAKLTVPLAETMLFDAGHISPYHKAPHGLRMLAAMTLYRPGIKLKAELDPASMQWQALSVSLDTCEAIAEGLPDLKLRDYMQAAMAYWRALGDAGRDHYLAAYTPPHKYPRMGNAQCRLVRRDWPYVVELGGGNRSKGARLLLDCLAQGIKKAP